MTKAQSKTLTVIKEFIAKHDYAPTYREVTEAAGLKSPANVYYHIQALKRQKLISVERGMRSLKVIDKCPHCGK